jgi:hypothetical protein
MHDKGESQPLNTGLNDLDDQDTDVESVGFIQEKARSRGLSVRQLIALIAAFAFCIIISGFAGAYVSAWFADSDALCAAHTSLWCQSLASSVFK